MHWLIQGNVFQEEKWQIMVNTLSKMGIPHSIHTVVPFSGELIPPAEIEPDTKVWAMGSLSMNETCKKNGWLPGCLEVADFYEQLNHWGNKMLNHGAIIETIEQLSVDKAFTRNEFFIRPIKDNKFIPGQIMTEVEIKEWAKDVVKHTPEHAQEVMILSTPQEIAYEARFWVVNGKVITWSQYKRGKTVVASHQMVDKDMIWFAQSLVGGFPEALKAWQPAKAFCLDICLTEDGEFKIVEINNINSSGFYDCDVQKLVMAIETAFNYNWE